MSKSLIYPTIALMLSLWMIHSVNAGIVFTAVENGSDVVISHTGFISDRDGFSFFDTSLGSSGFANFRIIETGGGAGNDFLEYQGFISGPDQTGISGTFSSSSDDGFHFGFDLLADTIRLDSNYVLGTDTSGSSIFQDTSLADMGIAPHQTTVWTLHNSARDTITLNVVPESSTVLLLGLGTVFFALRRRILKS